MQTASLSAAASSTSTSQKPYTTTGATVPVWHHLLPPTKYPTYPQLSQDLSTSVCIIGAGIAGISTAYELVSRGRSVILLDAAATPLAGETGRTSGHLTNDLDDGYVAIAGKHGDAGAKAAAESHAWAVNRVGEVAAQLGVECEYRRVPAYEVSQYARGEKGHADEVKTLMEEVEKAQSLGIQAEYVDGLALRGWDGAVDQRDAGVLKNMAAFHPTRYLAGVLGWLEKQEGFRCFTRTRVVDVKEEGVEVLGIGSKTVKVETAGGQTVTCEWAVEATAVPLQKLSVVAEMEYHRSYCIAVRIPKGVMEDCLIYDQAEEYKYVRLTECDDKDDYAIVGGCDHKVGQEDTGGRFEELEKWFRERFTAAGSVDYRWSGQIWEPVDFMAFIGKNPHTKRTYIVTGDSGDGLTHGVLAGRLIADDIDGKDNPWSKLYDPSRTVSIIKSLPAMLSHDIQINTQYKRFLQSDIQDIEDLGRGEGGVMNPKLGKPIAVYKDDKGEAHKFSALCPHLKGVVCWNNTEKSWDCPVHGSRFSKEGVCFNGPAKMGLQPADDKGEALQQEAIKA